MTLDMIMDRSAQEPNTGCWLWIRGVSSSGYGTVKINGVSRLAHRVAYNAKYKVWPYELMHICDQKLCVNPDHLRPCTHRDNIRDAAKKKLMGCNSENARTAKINWEIVRAIRADYKKGVGRKSLEFRYRLSRFIIRRVVENENWIEK